MQKFLIVGLGNPGANYAKNRHNVGFMAIDELLRQLNLKLDNTKFKGDFTKTIIDNNIVYIAKPQTYMNLSGEFVSKFINFFDIPKTNIIVIYDDVDTNVGKIKLRLSGSSGGQNGIKNIINLLSTQDIKRVRIGIGRNTQIPLDQYVLSNFKIDELVTIKPLLINVAFACIEFTKGESFEKMMNKYN
ncbi:peptidyl-tRNA hydrolase [Ureaplasma diversum]|uniref:Peptidyl-tRNA hydrolase n=1 Tax=Ureaplasma diversum TaxID=42094 RepID=A0A0C5RLK9_9BACT|nr:aminoacyl-tRNA hydrolase [Ureaplasma diversum]AJQ45317.1 peptidyl-tRNA hydrolase [Ureaplasma diversum]